MKKAKKWLALVAGTTLVLGAAVGMAACGDKTPEESGPKGPQLAEEIEAGSAFDGIHIKQLAKAPGWNSENQPSGQVCLSIGVDVTDWTGAEKFRFRVQNFCSVDVNEFQLNIGSSVTNDTTGATAWARASRKQDGGIKTYKLDGVTPNSPLTYPVANVGAESDGNDGSSFASLAASFTGYIEYDMEKAFGDTMYNIGAEANDGIMCWTYSNDVVNNSNPDSLVPLELARMKSIYFMFQPITYDNVDLCFSDFQIKKTGSNEWISVVDMSKAEVITKASGQTWREAVHGIGANKLLLDPWYDAARTEPNEANSTTVHFTLEKVTGVACNLHYDGDEDGVCDRCGMLIPHEVNDLAETGTCTTCNHTYCQTHKDDNKDGVCDTCGHLAK